MGALRAWVMVGVGLFLAYIMLTVVASINGVVFSLFHTLVEMGLIPEEWAHIYDSYIKGTYEGIFAFLPLLIFGTMIIYLVLESMRRRPEDQY